MVEVTVKKPPTLKLLDLLQVAKEYNPTADLVAIEKAYWFAKKAHAGQKRGTGEPFFQHPLKVAMTVAKLRLGSTAIIAALLHDVREDTSPLYEKQIATKFGETVDFLVQSVTKLSKVRNLRANRGPIEDLRTIFLAMNKDIRVMFIKLADRLHNLSTLQGLSPEKRRCVAKQTLDIYAPIADRLGIGNIKGQLEDLSFKHLMPEKEAWVRSLMKEAYKERTSRCNQLKLMVTAELKKNNIDVRDIHGRAKRLYSLYKKLQRNNQDISRIYDLVALRVIVPTEDECYQALGIIHKRWRPLVGKIKDYVATPKANGYQSLHTTVIIDQGTFVEIQIRTPKMHAQAEFGVAARWNYQENKHKTNTEKASLETTQKTEIDWVKQLASWQTEVENPDEFFNTLRSDFFMQRIFCLTPTGEIINLPEKATPVDFAYALHCQLGDHIVEAKVNGHVRTVDFVLASGDLVEIIVDKKNHGPKREWMDFVKTNSAKKNIKRWYARLNREKSITIGKQLLEDELYQLLGRNLKSIRQAKINDFLESLGYSDLEDLYSAVGHGKRNPRQVIKRLFADELFGKKMWLPKRVVPNVEVAGFAKNSLKRAPCCRPIEGDEIVAIPIDGQAVVHRAECTRIINEQKQLAAHWLNTSMRSYRTWININTRTYVGMLRDISNMCSQEQVPIHDVSIKNKDKISRIGLLIEIKNTDQLSEIIRRIKTLPEVVEVRRKKI